MKEANSAMRCTDSREGPGEDLNKTGTYTPVTITDGAREGIYVHRIGMRAHRCRGARRIIYRTASIYIERVSMEKLNVQGNDGCGIQGASRSQHGGYVVR